MKALLAALTALCVSYLAIAFVLWELDPSKWSGVERFILAWLGSLLAVGAAGFTLMESKQ